jgi:hypothetical protein
MKLRFTLFLFLLNAATFAQYNSKKQIDSLIEKYFIINPRSFPMAELIPTLEKKAGVVIDTIIPRTDSTIFYFRGYTTGFNPFNVPAIKAEFQIRESVVLGLNKIQIDTILIAQLFIITDSSERSKELCLAELKRINKEIKQYFPFRQHYKSRKKATMFFETYTYKERQFASLNTIQMSIGKYYQNPSIYFLGIETYYRYLPD